MEGRRRRVGGGFAEDEDTEEVGVALDVARDVGVASRTLRRWLGLAVSSSTFSSSSKSKILAKFSTTFGVLTNNAEVQVC